MKYKVRRFTQTKAIRALSTLPIDVADLGKGNSSVQNTPKVKEVLVNKLNRDYYDDELLRTVNRSKLSGSVINDPKSYYNRSTQDKDLETTKLSGLQIISTEGTEGSVPIQSVITDKSRLIDPIAVQKSQVLETARRSREEVNEFMITSNGGRYPMKLK